MAEARRQEETEIKRMYQGIKITASAKGRFAFWNRDAESPVGRLYHRFVTGRLVDPEEAREILGVTYCPDWQYVMSQRGDWLFAVKAVEGERARMPAVFPLPLPPHQISKDVLAAFREHYADDSLEYGDVARSFERGRLLLREEVSEVLGCDFTFEVPDQHNVLVEDGTAILVAKGPVRKQETRRDFSPAHYFAPYDIVGFFEIEVSHGA